MGDGNLQDCRLHPLYPISQKGHGGWQGALDPRDYFIKTYDVFNQLAKFEKLLFRKHTNDAQSVRLYQEEHRNKVRGGLQHRVCWTQGSTQGHNSTSGVCVCGGGTEWQHVWFFWCVWGRGGGGWGGGGCIPDGRHTVYEKWVAPGH
jgi:hypothetical protein